MSSHGHNTAEFFFRDALDAISIVGASGNIPTLGDSSCCSVRPLAGICPLRGHRAGVVGAGSLVDVMRARFPRGCYPRPERSRPSSHVHAALDESSRL